MIKSWFKGKREAVIEQKAVQSYSGRATSIYPTLPDQIKLTDDPVKLMSFNRGYVASANRRVAAGVSMLPYHLYAVVSDDSVKKLWTPHAGLDQKQAQLLRKAVPRLDTALRRPKTAVVEIYQHPFLDLLQRPAPGWSQTEFFSIISLYLGLIGNCYLVKEYNSDGILSGLRPLQSEFVAITYAQDGAITQYEFNPLNGQSNVKYKPEQIVHIRNRDAGSLIAGRGNLELCLDAFAASSAAYAYVNALLNNMAIPGSMITFDNITIPEGVDPQTYLQEVEAAATSRFGAKNRGKPFVSFGATKWTKMDTSMADTRIETFVDGAKKEIAAAFGVPVSMIDDTDANRATAYASQRAFKTYAVLPKAGSICDQLTNVVMDNYDPNLYLWWDPKEALDTDPLEQSQVLTAYTGAGVITVNEARAAMGMEPITGGDELKVQPVTQITAQPRPL